MPTDSLGSAGGGRLRDKVAVVTGAGGAGCGRAIAVRLAAEGAAVVVCDIDEAGGEETVQLIGSRGGKAVFARADVREEPQVRELMQFSVRTFGSLDVLVNDASGPFRPGEETEHWASTVQTDLVGTLHAIRHAIEAMRHGGAIVNIASISSLWHGRRISRGIASTAYDAAKAGVIRLTTTLEWLMPKYGIRVNCLAPGWIATAGPREYWESLSPEERRDRGVPSVLLTPEQIAAAVLRLATDQSLVGRVLVWWSEDRPRLISWGDRGYAEWEAVADIT
jgi:NAD(P)-dependent dehydrogenase (short-subunit alcohol dehydrogenase family)